MISIFFSSLNTLMLYIRYFSLNSTDSRSNSSAGQHFLWRICLCTISGFFFFFFFFFVVCRAGIQCASTCMLKKHKFISKFIKRVKNVSLLCDTPVKCKWKRGHTFFLRLLYCIKHTQTAWGLQVISPHIYTSAVSAGAFPPLLAKQKPATGLPILSKEPQKNMLAMHTLTFWSQSCKSVIRRGCAVSN